MIVNLLRFAFREGTTPEQEEEVLAAMRRTASLDPVAFSAVGRDIGDPAEGFTHTYLVGIPDLAALERYMHDPVHISGDEVILPHLARLGAVRMADDADPGVGAEVAALHRAKVAKYPEWGRALDALAV
ncbi:Dabb family protein [Actinosynnema sp. NPDC059797]